MKIILALFAAMLFVAPVNAVVITCVSEGNNVARIDYDATNEKSLPIAFALDITVDGGATIKDIYDFKVGDSNAKNPGFGIFPRSIKFNENGNVIDWGSPDVNAAGATGVKGGLGTSGLTIEMASKYDGNTTNAPLKKDYLCRILVDPQGAKTVNVKAAANTAGGGVVLEDATTAKFSAVGCTLNIFGTNQNIAGAFQQDDAANGIVSIEAEDFNNNVTVGSYRWNLITSPAGCSGGYAMQALPDNGALVDTGYITGSPRLDFRVNFVKTGIHYIWVRGYKTGSTDDSLHAGLDGLAVSSCDRISNLPTTGSWVWTSTTIDSNSRATFNVSSIGIHTVNIWMREDGFRIDKIILTTDPNYKPTGTGPAESPINQPPPYRQDSGSNSIVSMEAENYHDNITQGGHNWTLITSPTGCSGGYAMQALPDNGALIDRGSSPRLDFRVNFVKTGTHYIWVRGYKTGGTDDSLNAGLDGQAVSSCNRISNFPTAGSWVWTSTTMNSGARATFNISSTGVHTVNIWMREDGMRIDKIVLTTNPAYIPTGNGPAKNPRGG
jgi:hypothetical protein